MANKHKKYTEAIGYIGLKCSCISAQHGYRIFTPQCAPWIKWISTIESVFSTDVGSTILKKGIVKSVAGVHHGPDSIFFRKFVKLYFKKYQSIAIINFN